MKSLKNMNMSDFWFLVQKIKRLFLMALFLTHLFYFSSIFATGREGIVIKEEPAETIGIKKEPENPPALKGESSETVSKKLPSPDIYEQLWEKVQKDENLSEVKKIIEKYAINFHRKNHQGETILHIAIKAQAIAVTAYLLSYAYSQGQFFLGPSSNLMKIQDDAGQMILNDLLYFAMNVRNEDFLHFLFGKILVSNTKNSILHFLAVDDQNTQLTQALTKKFIKLNLSINNENDSGFTPLMLAVLYGNLPVMDTLIESEASVIANIDKSNSNILHFAALKVQNETALKYLINKLKKIDVLRLLIDKTDQLGHTPLMDAINAGNLAAAKALIEANPKLDLCNKKGDSALYLSVCYLPDKDFVQSLIKKLKKQGLSFLINETNKKGTTPLAIALAFAVLNDGNLAPVEALIEGGAELIVNNFQTNILHLAGQRIKDQKILQHLIRIINKNGQLFIINHTDYRQKTPLVYAVESGNLAAIDALIEAGASLTLNLPHEDNALHEQSILHFAVMLDSIDKTVLEGLIKACTKAGLSINHMAAQNSTPLMNAARHGNLIAVKALLEANAKLDILDKNKKNVLHYAACSKNKASLEFLIEKFKEAKLDIDQIDQNGSTPLVEALVNGNKVALDLLIEGGASLIPPSHNGSTGNSILHWAAQLVKEQPILQNLIDKVTKKGRSRKTIDINQTNNLGYTPCMMSALAGNIIASEIFVKAGAKFDMLTPNKQNALHLAASIVKDKTFFQAFIKLFQQSKSKQVKAQVNQQDKNGYTPLMIALLNSNIIAAKELMNANAKLDILTPIQNSILHIAVSRIKDKDFLQFLIKKCKKLDINQKNQKGLSPLMIAVLKSNQEAIKELIKAKAEWMHPEPNADKSILHFAGKYAKDKATVQYLVNEYKAAGLDINPRDQKGYTPLMTAVYNSNQEAIDAFIENGAVVAVSRGIGNILHFAAMHVKDKGLFQYLINKCQEAGLVDIYQANENGYTPFMVAASTMNLAAVEALLELDATLNLNIGQESALHIVVRHIKDKAFMKLLLKTFKEANLSIDNINEDGHTPLMVAVRSCNLAVAEALIEANAKLHLLTKENENALHLAAAYVKDKAFVEFLINAFKKAMNSMDNSDQEQTSALEHESMKKNLDINLMTQYKETALMIAVLNGNLAVIDALIDGGSTLFVPTENTENIVDFANRCVKSKKMIEHLRKKYNQANVVDIHSTIL